jgi:peroxiredoxin
MGRKSRLKAERRAAPPPPIPKPMLKARKVIFTATLAIAVVVVLIVGILLLTKKTSPVVPPAASISAADRNAPASLVSAAQAVGFHPTTEPGVGKIESQPASAANPPSNPDLLAVGTKAPSFALKTPEGQKVSLSGFLGKATLLEFFATWCPHCNAEAPHLAKLSTSLPASKYAFVSVNADGETAPSVFAFHLYYGLDYPALVDPSAHPGSFDSQGAAGKVSTAYRVESYPTFYVIDPKGKIAWASDGEQPDALLRQQLVKAAGA